MDWKCIVMINSILTMAVAMFQIFVHSCIIIVDGMLWFHIVSLQLFLGFFEGNEKRLR